MDIKTVNILRGTEFLEINLRDFKELFENLLKKAENGEEVIAMKRKISRLGGWRVLPVTYTSLKENNKVLVLEIDKGILVVIRQEK
jgi:hypothetical protein